MIDHTLLRPTATALEVKALCDDAVDMGVFAVCVSPTMVKVAARRLPASVAVATVCGFPSGAHRSDVKALEATAAVDDGAAEVDMVANLGLVHAADWQSVTADIAEVRRSVPGPLLLKVIIESAALTDEEITETCLAAERAGADFVKTSTGFHRAGGASVAAVETMSRAVGGRLGIKASGGIHSAAAALDLVQAGATRLGMSHTREVLGGLEPAGTH